MSKGKNSSNANFTDAGTDDSPDPQAMLRLIADSVPALISYVDRDLRYLMVNRAYSEWFGIPADEIVGKSMAEVLGEEAFSTLKPTLQRALDGKTSVFEGRTVYRTGPREIRAIYTPNSASDGSVKGLCVLVLDITEQRTTDIALRSSEERYRAFVEQSNEGIWRFELDKPMPLDLPTEEKVRWAYEYGYLAECNTAMARQYGYEKPEEIVGARMKDLYVENDPANDKILYEFFENGLRATDAESHERDIHGNDKYFLNNFVGILEDGYFVRGWGTQRDVTEEKKRQKSAAHMAAIIGSSEDAIVSKDLSGIVTSWNTGAEHIFGYSAEEMIGESIRKLLPAGRASEEEDILSRIGRGQRIQHFETVRRRKDGSLIDVSLSVSPIVDEAGEIIGAAKIARDITEQKRSEQQLRESEALLAIAMQSSRMGAWELDIDSNLVHWTPELEEIFGLEPGTFGGTRDAFRELILDEDRAEVEVEIERAISEGRDYVIEFRFRHSDGSIRWMEGRGKAFCADDGRPVRVYGIGIDITERKSASEALHTSEHRYQTLFNTIDEGFCTIEVSFDESGIGRDYRFLEANPAFASHTGLDDVVGKSMRDLKPNHEEHWFHIYGEVVKSRQPRRFESPAAELGRWYDVYAFPIDPPESNQVGVLFQDITERKRSQEALIAAERSAVIEYQALLSRIVPLAQTLGAARDLTTIYRAVKDFVFSSTRCTGFFVSFYDEETSERRAAYAWGDEGEVNTANLPAMLLTDDGGPNSRAVFERRPVVINNYMDYMKSRPHMVIGRNGINPSSSIAVPMIVQNRVTGTIEAQAYENDAFDHEHVVALEMAANLAAVAIENVRLIENEAKARQEAESANRTKDEFLSVLSHELRTPLNSMLGWLRMLRGGILDEDQKAKAIEVIERNTRVQSSLIEDLLDVSRIISGKMRIETELIDLTPVLQSACETIRPLALSKDVEFDCDIDESPLFIEGDAMRIQQVVTNLLQNGVKFTEAGGTVSLTIDRSPKEASITVRDTGIGIEKDMLPFIFDRFRQADATTRRGFSGLGLGLTIVKTITQMHGGSISVHSDGLDKGSQFTITLPLARSAYFDEAVTESMPAGSEAHSLSGVEILIVDDDRDGLLALKTFLENQDAAVSAVETPAEALERLNAGKYDLLISDVGMPEMDGYELIAKVREAGNGSGIPAIALTAYASGGDRQKALDAGFQTHLAKPLNFDDLLKAIRKLRRR